MPDLTVESYWVCRSAEEWSTEIAGSNGTVYTVTWDRFSHKNRQHYQYDYSCTCPAYKFGKGRPCKHIEAAKKLHCNWRQFVRGGDPTVTDDGQHVCPDCGGELTAEQQGV